MPMVRTLFSFFNACQENQKKGQESSSQKLISFCLL